MMADSLSAPDSERGKDESKDFVEHLRTVHFALVATCVALLVIVTSANKKIEDAFSQLKKIADSHFYTVNFSGI